jgi:NAD(P)-dependent dehydrogenase (short-subunit alcohol dehydrogenase family)
MMDFRERRAVVTGAADGIGEAIARQLSDLGASVIAVDRDEAALEAAFAGSAIATVVGDLATSPSEALAGTVLERFGLVDLIVNNVGIDTEHNFLRLEQAQFDLVFDTNLRGPWFFTKRFVAELIQRGTGGAIVFVSSLHDHIVRRLPHYSASKAAVAMLVRELAYELGPHGIRVNAVSPGVIRSARVPEPCAQEAARLRHIIRLGGRQGTPMDVARVVAMLLSDEWCRYVTGANVPVDGGLGLHTWSIEPDAARAALPSDAASDG